MRILQVITPARVSGAERSTASLCEHLVRTGHEVVVTCKRGSPFIPYARSLGLEVEEMAIGGKANLAAPVRIAGLARRWRADVIHSHLSTASLWSSVAGHLLGRPAVAHVRALNSRTCFMLADRVIAISEAVRDHLVEQGMQGEQIDVVYSGIDPGRYYSPCSRAEARAALGLTDAEVSVGVLAHLTPRKGHAVLLEALSLLRDRRLRPVCLFAGAGDRQEEIEALAHRLDLSDRVRFLGDLEDVLPLYAALDIVVLPAISGEGLPRTLLEAGYLRIPTIGTRLSGIPEIIRDGETGFVVPVADAPALAERLETLVLDPELRCRMGAAAAEWIRGRFTIEAMLSGTLACYRRAGAAAG